jgi:tripartite-type tricarboxylate transporter receptor subunit TctC
MHRLAKAARAALATAALAIAASSTVGLAHAETYPSKPIRVIVPYAAGGFSDVSARIVAEAMSRSLGQPLLVEARPGGGGRIGAEAIARAAPDGYQILYTTNGTHTYMAVVEKSLPYDPLRDFTPVSLVGVYGLLMVIDPSIPARNVAEFIAYAKKNPGKINYGSSGAGSGIHFAGEVFNFMAGIDMVHVPYKGSGPAMQDVIAGNCQVTFDGAAKPFIDSGKVRFLGTTSARRDPRFPDAPTLAEAGAESGLSGYDLTYWTGIFGPAGLAPEVQTKLNAAVNAALADDTVKKRLADMGVVPVGGAPDVLPRQIRTETEALRKIAADARLVFQ